MSVGALLLLSLTGCGHSYRSFAALASDAADVPVPAGVAFVSAEQHTNDGPGFTTTKSEEATRQFRTALPCADLERAWASALRAEHRRFAFDDHPHAFGSIGSLGIRITDRPEFLGVTLGTDDGHCTRPFVYAFNANH